MNKNETKLRRVLVGTPTIDGKVDAHYTFSLIETIKLCAMNQIIVLPHFIAYDSLVQRARNDIVKVAVESEVDDLIFIDSDMAWNPHDFLRIISHDVDLVGGTARRKDDYVESYVITLEPSKTFLNIQPNGLAEVLGVGTGFMRLTRKCFTKLWYYSPEYREKYKTCRLVCNVTIEDGLLVSEDISICRKWRSLGEKVWFDTQITCDHIGVKKYSGNFMLWYDTVYQQQHNKLNMKEEVNERKDSKISEE